jgi:hypothetical protein
MLDAVVKRAQRLFGHPAASSTHEYPGNAVVNQPAV